MIREHAEQVEVVRWLRAANIFHCAIPNGARTSIGAARKLKAEGLVSGAPDLLIFDPPPNLPGRIGTALEMKREKGSYCSPAQREYLEEMRQRGWAIIVGKGAVHALQQLAAFGYRVPT